MRKIKKLEYNVKIKYSQSSLKCLIIISTIIYLSIGLLRTLSAPASKKDLFIILSDSELDPISIAF